MPDWTVVKMTAKATMAMMNEMADKTSVRIPERWKFASPPLPPLIHRGGTTSESAVRREMSAAMRWRYCTEVCPELRMGMTCVVSA